MLKMSSKKINKKSQTTPERLQDKNPRHVLDEAQAFLDNKPETSPTRCPQKIKPKLLPKNCSFCSVCCPFCSVCSARFPLDPQTLELRKNRAPTFEKAVFGILLMAAAGSPSSPPYLINIFCRWPKASNRPLTSFK